MSYILAILLPPIATLFYGGLFSFLINIVLTLLIWPIGILHAVIVVNASHQKKNTKKIIKALTPVVAKKEPTGWFD